MLRVPRGPGGPGPSGLHPAADMAPPRVSGRLLQLYLCGVFHEEGALNVGKGDIWVQLQDPFHLTRTLEEKVCVHSEVVNGINFSVDKVEDKALPGIASVDAARVEVREDRAYDG